MTVRKLADAELVALGKEMLEASKWMKEELQRRRIARELGRPCRIQIVGPMPLEWW